LLLFVSYQIFVPVCFCWLALLDSSHSESFCLYTTWPKSENTQRFGYSRPHIGATKLSVSFKLDVRCMRCELASTSSRWRRHWSWRC